MDDYQQIKEIKACRLTGLPTYQARLKSYGAVVERPKRTLYQTMTGESG